MKIPYEFTFGNKTFILSSVKDVEDRLLDIDNSLTTVYRQAAEASFRYGAVEPINVDFETYKKQRELIDLLRVLIGGTELVDNALE